MKQIKNQRWMKKNTPKKKEQRDSARNIVPLKFVSAHKTSTHIIMIYGYDYYTYSVFSNNCRK